MSRPFRERQQFGIDTKRLRSSRRVRKHVRKSKFDGIPGLLNMPDEILLDLVPYLHLPDLEALSITCRSLNSVFSANLSDEQTLAREKLRDLTLDSDEYGYHDLLLGILKREVNPNYIKRLDCRRSYGSFACRREEGGEIDVARYIGWTSEDIGLIRAEILRSSWLENITTPDELIDKMLHKDEDAVLVLLVPLMKNLCRFLPPCGVPLLRQVFVKIARAQIEAELAHPDIWQRLPLRRLHTIFASLNMLGTPLGDTIHFMSLPSVRHVFLDSLFLEDLDDMRRANIRSSTEIPRSRASTVYIRSSEIWRSVAEIFAEYLIGPCIIRQYMCDPMPDEAEIEVREAFVALRMAENGVTTPPDLMSEYWDHCTISPGQTEDPFMAKHWASQAYEGLENRTSEFTIKYRAFHLDTAEDDLEQYEAEIRQAGIVPSPQWLALAKWNRYLVQPEELDDESFMLEE